jgi:hypothetical protein
MRMASWSDLLSLDARKPTAALHFWKTPGLTVAVCCRKEGGVRATAAPLSSEPKLPVASPSTKIRNSMFKNNVWLG